jgi:hyperosmotically inducible protein
MRQAWRAMSLGLGALMVIAAAGTGHAQTSPQVPGGGATGAPGGIANPETDEWLTVKIQTALYSDMRFMGRGLAVDTVQGVVTLRGKVDSDQSKAAAATIARSIPGVRDVRNELRVVPFDQRGQVDTRDDEIGRLLTGRFKQDPELKDDLITIRVDASVVTLIGEVKTAAASARAADLAHGVPGVSDVENELTYLSPPLMAPARRSGRGRGRPSTEK